MTIAPGESTAEGLANILFGRGPTLLLASHEPAMSIDSSQPVVCRFCGEVKPTLGSWLTMCLRTPHRTWWTT